MQESNVANKNRKSNGRREIDPVFKETVCSKFDLPGVQVQTQVEVSRLPRTIDAILTTKLESGRAMLRNGTPFYYAKTYNYVAFKGINDTLNSSELRMILGRVNLHMGSNDIPDNETTITIVSSRKPVKLLKPVPEQSEESKSGITFLPSGRPGYYRSDNNPPVNLIVVNELEVVPKNYPLLLFASSKKKFEEYLLDTVKNNCFGTYVEFAYSINPEKTREVIEMSNYGLSKDKLQFMAKDIGPELLPFIPVKDRLAGLTAEDRLAGLTAEDRLIGLTAAERKKLEQFLRDDRK